MAENQLKLAQIKGGYCFERVWVTLGTQNMAHLGKRGQAELLVSGWSEGLCIVQSFLWSVSLLHCVFLDQEPDLRPGY